MKLITFTADLKIMELLNSIISNNNIHFDSFNAAINDLLLEQYIKMGVNKASTLSSIACLKCHLNKQYTDNDIELFISEASIWLKQYDSSSFDLDEAKSTTMLLINGNDYPQPFNYEDMLAVCALYIDELSTEEKNRLIKLNKGNALKIVLDDPAQNTRNGASNPTHLWWVRFRTQTSYKLKHLLGCS